MEGSRPSVRFEVEKIIGVSSDGNYQVQWAPAWVSKFHLVGCEHLIQEFLQQQQQQQQQKPQQKKQQEHEQPSEVDNHLHNKSNNTMRIEPAPTVEGTSEGEYEILDNHPHEKQQHQQNNQHPRNTRPSNNYDSTQYINESAHFAEAPPLVSDFKKEEEEENDQVYDVDNSEFTSKGDNQTLISVQFDDTEQLMDAYNDDDTSSSLLLTGDLTPENRSKNYQTTASDDYKKFTTKSQCSKRHHQCPYCDKKYTMQATLYIHIRTHTGEKPYTCPVCDKSFSVKCNFETHKRIHTKIKPFACDKCGKCMYVCM